MNPSHGLPPQTIDRITKVLARFPGVKQAILFGSRAKSTHRPGSDIDLALTGAALDSIAVGKIDDALDDLLLPYRFSLIIYDENTDREVAAHIVRVGVLLYEREHIKESLPRQ